MMPFPMVGMVAAAGSLEALSELLSGLPATRGMAVLPVQHLDPGIPFDDMARRTLHQAPSPNRTLETSHRFRQDSKQLRTRSALTGEARVQALENWRKQAKGTGIEALPEFCAIMRREPANPRWPIRGSAQGRVGSCRGDSSGWLSGMAGPSETTPC